MENTVETYCVECDECVTAAIEERNETLEVRGEPVSYTARVAVCPRCGGEIGDSRVEEANLERAYSAYRKSHNIVSQQDIASLRDEMGLSMREFSKLLGFGEQTAARYETSGALPDALHSSIIRLAGSPAGARFLLSENGARISQSSVDKVEKYIARKSSGIESMNPFGGIWSSSLGESAEPCAANGYRPLDYQRVAAVAVRLAEGCAELFKTKFQKAMFFSDFLGCERFGRSLTGLCYAHADFGPVINNYDMVMAKLKYDGYIDMEQSGWGEIVNAASEAPDVLTSDEISLVDEVAEFVDSFGSAKDISSYSHDLQAWSGTKSGQIINYNANYGEISAAVESRMSPK